MRVLIVDDEPLVAQTLGIIFRKSGFDVRTANTAVEGLEFAMMENPDLVLCDIDMPGRDGVALMEDLGRELPECPILVLTGAYNGLGRVHACANTLRQTVSILTKPCQPLELLRQASSMLRTA